MNSFAMKELAHLLEHSSEVSLRFTICILHCTVLKEKDFRRVRLLHGVAAYKHRRRSRTAKNACRQEITPDADLSYFQNKLSKLWTSCLRSSDVDNGASAAARCMSSRRATGLLGAAFRVAARSNFRLV